MRILQINKFHFIAGGAERYYLELSNLLSQKGHKIAHFSMKHPENIPSKWSKYFVSNVIFKGDYFKNGFKAFTRLIYSLEAKRKIGKLLDDFKPEIVHIHNIYGHISPSILPEIKKRGIPIFYTLHDYHIISPNVVMFHNGAICEDDGKLSSIFSNHKFIDNSLLLSVGMNVVWNIHKALKLYSKFIDVYISPSSFMKAKAIDRGFSERNIVYLPNFLYPITNYRPTISKPYIFYFGRLSPHKGVSIIVKVAKMLPHIVFRIAGTGYEEKSLRKSAKRYRLKNLEFLGRLDKKDLEKYITNSLFCVVPSLWYENMPYSVLEAFALGKPVIASRIGGLPELVKNGENGYLFKPGGVSDLINKIIKLLENPELIRKMGEKARKDAEKKYTPEIHYRRLIMLYKKAIRENTLIQRNQG